jgi:hypothetical protein
LTAGSLTLAFPDWSFGLTDQGTLAAVILRAAIRVKLYTLRGNQYIGYTSMPVQEAARDRMLQRRCMSEWIILILTVAGCAGRD